MLARLGTRQTVLIWGACLSRSQTKQIGGWGNGNIATTRQLLAQAVRHLDQLSSSERSGSPASDLPPRHSDISSNVKFLELGLVSCYPVAVP